MVLLKDLVGAGMILRTIELVGRYLRQQMDATFYKTTSQCIKTQLFIYDTMMKTKVSPIKKTLSPAKKKLGK